MSLPHTSWTVVWLLDHLHPLSLLPSASPPLYLLILRPGSRSEAEIKPWLQQLLHHSRLLSFSIIDPLLPSHPESHWESWVPVTCKVGQIQELGHTQLSFICLLLLWSPTLWALFCSPLQGSPTLWTFYPLLQGPPHAGLSVPSSRGPLDSGFSSCSPLTSSSQKVSIQCSFSQCVISKGNLVEKKIHQNVTHKQ